MVNIEAPRSQETREDQLKQYRELIRKSIMFHDYRIAPADLKEKVVAERRDLEVAGVSPAEIRKYRGTEYNMQNEAMSEWFQELGRLEEQLGLTQDEMHNISSEEWRRLRDDKNFQILLLDRDIQKAERSFSEMQKDLEKLEGWSLVDVFAGKGMKGMRAQSYARLRKLLPQVKKELEDLKREKNSMLQSAAGVKV